MCVPRLSTSSEAREGLWRCGKALSRRGRTARELTAPSRSRLGFEVGYQTSRCGSVGAEKVDSNHSATAGWKLDKDILEILGDCLIISSRLPGVLYQNRAIGFFPIITCAALNLVGIIRRLAYNEIAREVYGYETQVMTKKYSELNDRELRERLDGNPPRHTRLAACLR